MIGAADSEEFRKRLLNEAGVAVLADIHFGARVPGEGQHVRFSYAASKQAIEAGVARMADFIRKNTDAKQHDRLEAVASTVAAVIERDGRFLFVEERDRRPAGAQPARRPPRSGRVAGRRVPRAKCSRKRRTASSRRALVGIYRWHYAPQDVTFLRFCFRGRHRGRRRAAARQGDRRAALAHRATSSSKRARASTARRSCSAASTTTSRDARYPLELFSTEYRVSESSSACRAASTPRSPRCCSSAQGYDVVGLFMKNWEDDDDDEYCSTRAGPDRRGRGGRRDRHRARGGQLRRRVQGPRVRRVPARVLGRPHAQPRRAVQRRDQVQGVPRPCDAPGRGEDRHRALRAGRRARTAASSCCKGADAAKDQSYFLHRLNQEQLSRALFPVGELKKTRGAAHRARGRAAQPRQEGLDRHLLHRRAAVPRVPEPLPAEGARADQDAGRPDASASTSGSPSTPSASGRASASAAWRT